MGQGWSLAWLAASSEPVFSARGSGGVSTAARRLGPPAASALIPPPPHGAGPDRAAVATRAGKPCQIHPMRVGGR